MEEIQNTVLEIKNNKAPGPDGIPIEFFKALFSKSDLSLKKIKTYISNNFPNWYMAPLYGNQFTYAKRY